MFKIRSKILLLFFIFILLTVTYSGNLEPKPHLTRANQITEALSTFPLYFIENKGQVNGCVKYHLKMPKGNVYFTPEEIVYQFIQRRSDRTLDEKNLVRPGEENSDETIVENIRMEFVGANERVKVEGLEESEGKVSYFRGKNPEKWVSGARAYKKVLYQELYPHTDLLVYARGGNIKKEYRVREGGDVDKIRVRYEGIEQLRVNEKGQLEILTGEGLLKEDAPLSYQLIEGERVEVQSEYIVVADCTLKYKIGDYRKDKELIIDPALYYSTYLGGSDSDVALAIAVDDGGNAYVTGLTSSTDFPLTGGSYDPSYSGGSYDVFVTRFNTTGSGFVYSTYLGGSDSDVAWGIALDESRNAYLTGITESNDFPTTSGAFDSVYHGAYDGFVAKLNSTGSALIYSTYLGGIANPLGNDYAYDIAVDENENAYVTGFTYCSTFPTTPGAFDTSFENTDAFVTKLNPEGSDLIYSTFLGGSDWEYGLGIAVDGNGNAYVAGSTASPDFPATSGAYDTSYNGGSYDAFVTKLNSAGSGLVFSTYLGGTGVESVSMSESGGGIALDEGGNAYVTGYTTSTNFPTTTGAFDRTHNGDRDAFVTKLNSTGTGLSYSTYLGGSDSDTGCEIVVDGKGNAYVTGETRSTNFPNTACAVDRTYNGELDAFITKFNSTGTGVFYSSYLGGIERDVGRGIQIGENARAYVAGFSKSDNFPTTSGANDRNLNGDADGFVTVTMWHQPPVNLSLKREINRSLFVKEAFHTISWEANPLNQNIEIWYYRVYRKLAGEGDESYQWIDTVSSDTFEYVDGYLDVNVSYVYAVTSVCSCLWNSDYSEPVGN